MKEDGVEIVKTNSKVTVLGIALQVVRKQELPKVSSKYIREIDKILPGKHVKQLYDNFKRLMPRY